MRILHANKFLFLKGGAERYLLDVAQAQEEAGHTVALWGMQHAKNTAPQRLEDALLVPPIDFDTVGGRLQAAGRIIHSSVAKRLAIKAVDAFKPEVVHIHNIYHQLSPSCLPVFKVAGARIVMTVHDYKLICPNYSLFTEGSPCERCHKHKYWNAAVHKCLKDSTTAGALAAVEMWTHKLSQVYEKNVDLFLAPSRFVQEKLIAFGMPAEKIRVLPLFLPKGASVATTQGTKPEKDEKEILLVTRFVALKGVEEALQTFRLLADKKPNGWKLTIAGDGPRRAQVEETVERLGLSKYVRLVGFLDSAALREAYTRADMVFVATKAWETFGYALLEGMAAGKPVVAPRLGGLPELVQEGKEGFLFTGGVWEEAAQLLERLLDEEGQAQQMGAAARMAAGRYNPQDHLSGLIQAYNS